MFFERGGADLFKAGMDGGKLAGGVAAPRPRTNLARDMKTLGKGSAKCAAAAKSY
jgi:hypothetical protein